VCCSAEDEMRALESKRDWKRVYAHERMCVRVRERVKSDREID